MEDKKERVTEIVHKYLQTDTIEDTTNLYGVASARSILYILLEIKDTFQLEISDGMLKRLKVFSIRNLCSVIEK